MSLISQSEWARRQGFSRQYVNKLIASGKLKLIDGKIDESKANMILMNQRDPSLPIRRTGNSAYSSAEDVHSMYAKAKLKNEISRGKILDARAKTELGQLVSLEEVKKIAFARGRIVRDSMLNIPDRVSALIATIDDSSQIHEILTKEIRSALEEVSNNYDQF